MQITADAANIAFWVMSVLENREKEEWTDSMEVVQVVLRRWLLLPAWSFDLLVLTLLLELGMLVARLVKERGKGTVDHV